MLEKIKIKVRNYNSPNDKAVIETEIDVLKGVKDVSVDESSHEISVEFESSLISADNIIKKLRDLGYATENDPGSFAVPREYLYYVSGMHCASCEILIEKKLLSIKGVKSVEAKTNKGEVLIEYVGQRPGINMLNSIFRKDNYSFSDRPIEEKNEFRKNDIFVVIGFSLLVIVGFILLNKSGLAGLINIGAKSSLPMFFIFGLLAGISTCAALVGGLILSMSKQWNQIYQNTDSTFQKFQPHLMFNTGRLVSYAIFGGILGAIGSQLQISLQFSSFLVIAVSVMMVFLALQMLGVKAFRRFQFTLPKSFTRYVADESNFKGRYMPAIMGGSTFFLPCGFTITAQGLALLAGNPLQGSLIMLFFALGTAPALLAIGLSSVKLSQKPHLSYRFLKIAGVLVLFFAFFNINNQLNVLGVPSLTDLSLFGQNQSGNNQYVQDDKDLPPIVNGKQLIKMNASSRGYSPNSFKVVAGVPVRWEITDTGTGGCTNAIISRSLFDGQISLTPGQLSVKEFTPEKAGKYKFSCWMGMVSGIIEVVDRNGSSNAVGNILSTANAAGNDDVIPSGAKGCGCGGGGSGSCGIQ